MPKAAWRDVVRDAVDARAAETVHRSPGASATANISRVGFSAEVHPFVVRAAKARGISISGYIRRSTLAMAALDLGLDVVDLLEKDCAVAPPGRIGAWPSKDLDGALYGRWEIERREPGADD